MAGLGLLVNRLQLGVKEGTRFAFLRFAEFTRWTCVARRPYVGHHDLIAEFME